MMQIVAMFTKYWEPGRVKTRLARDVGDQKAAHLYRLFVTYLADELRSTGDSRLFVVSPDDRCSDFGQVNATSWESIGQGPGDLGARLLRYFEAHLEADREIVVIGGDCLAVDRQVMEISFQGFRESPIVLGPSVDGGYYLLGIRGPWRSEYARLFSDIQWGTETVLNETLLRIRELGIEPVVLPPHSDVDDIDDLRSFRNRFVDIDDPSAKELADAIADVFGGTSA